MIFNVITPLARFQNVSDLVNHLEPKKIKWHVITDEDSKGTFDVKTTFASSPLLRITGTGLSGSIGGITVPITQYSAGTWNFTSAGALSACSSPFDFVVYTANGMLTSGQVAYYDQYGITPITGYTFFSNGSLIYAINSSTGVISTSSARCGR